MYWIVCLVGFAPEHTPLQNFISVSCGEQTVIGSYDSGVNSMSDKLTPIRLRIGGRTKSSTLGSMRSLLWAEAGHCHVASAPAHIWIHP